MGTWTCPCVAPSTGDWALLVRLFLSGFFVLRLLDDTFHIVIVLAFSIVLLGFLYGRTVLASFDLSFLAREKRVKGTRTVLTNHRGLLRSLHDGTGMLNPRAFATSCGARDDRLGAASAFAHNFDVPALVCKLNNGLFNVVR